MLKSEATFPTASRSRAADITACIGFLFQKFRVRKIPWGHTIKRGPDMDRDSLQSHYKDSAPILGNPEPYKPPSNPSFYFIAPFLVHLILQHWGIMAKPYQSLHHTPRHRGLTDPDNCYINVVPCSPWLRQFLNIKALTVLNPGDIWGIHGDSCGPLSKSIKGIQGDSGSP